MPADIIQDCSWPGVLAVESATYVCSHGISPGRGVITTYPQAAAPADFGNLTFSDGQRTVTVRGCKVDRIIPQMTQSGTTYTIEVLDERWQWGGLGGINGHYNEKDKRGKLIPWTIRSPQELAAICFRALAIRNGVVQFPPGIPSAAGKNVERYLQLGENFPQTFTNPEVTWDHTPPAEALAQLADMFGCRVIYQPAAARVLVVPLGTGKALPNLPYEMIGQTIDAPTAPAYVGVFGPPVKIQTRFLLEAVGEEWHGGYLPINQLSYSPVQQGANQSQKSQIKYTGGATVENLSVTVSFTEPRTGTAFSFTANHTGAATVAQRLNGIKTKLETNPPVGANFGLVFDGATKLIFTGKTPFAFSLSCFNPSSAVESFIAEDVQPFKKAGLGGGWDYSIPPSFWNVQPTAELSYTQAKALAVKTVYKCYRIMNRDPHDFGPHDQKGRQMELPWYGKIIRRQQIVLQDSMVEQVVPAPRIAGAIDKGNRVNINAAGQGVLPEFYNGYSRDQAPRVYGSIWRKQGYVNWQFATKDAVNESVNTEPEARVFVPFSINQVEQMITFAEPVFYFLGGAGGGSLQREAVLTLETGCFVLDAETNTPKRWEELLRIPGGIAPVEWTYRDDVQVGVIGRYTLKNKLVGKDFLDIADAKARAGYYLRGQARKFLLVGGETRQYIGIVPHDPDGFTQQVSWSVGAGATTIVSGNTEFHPAIPPFPARRRAEALPPDKSAAAVNLIERNFSDQAKPKEVK